MCSSDLWTFKPLQTSVRVHPGELTTVMYEIRNTAQRPVTGQAIPSYGPQIAVRYFKKLECFCFTQQTLQPGEARQMPVVFVIERGLPDDIHDLAAYRAVLAEAHTVYHLACLGVRHSVHSPVENHDVNATGTLRLLEARGHKLRPTRAFGSAQTIHRARGILMGAADSRQRGTGAIGY
mgnify:CR=1 FL=1